MIERMNQEKVITRSWRDVRELKIWSSRDVREFEPRYHWREKKKRVKLGESFKGMGVGTICSDCQTPQAQDMQDC